jgi:hypothetical protein
MTRTAFLLACFAVLSVPAAAQTFEPPRTRDGRPDFQGTWTNPWITPMERMPEAQTVVIDAAEARRVQEGALARMSTTAPLNADGYANEGHTGNLIAIVNGEYRAALVVDPPDGKLPFQPGARPGPLRPPPPPETYEVMPPSVRCIGGGGPLLLLPSEFLRTIVQTTQSLVVYSEAPHEARIFRIGGAHLPAALKSRAGDSIAQWEGDTLVVETTQVRSDNPLRFVPGSSPWVMRDSAKLIERFTLVGPDEILYQFTVDDPVIYARPWIAEFSLVRTSKRQFESACHEGNYALVNILQGARAQDKRVARDSADH